MVRLNMVLIRYTLKPILQALVIYIGLCALSTFSAHAQNALRIDGISGASNYTIDSATNGAVIYGGIAGSATAGTCASASSTSTCDSCSGSTILDACNPRRIHTGLDLNITFTITGELSGRAQLHYDNGSSTSAVTNSRASTGTTTIGKGTTVTVTADWGSICGNFAAGACDTTVITKRLYICVSGDATCETTERVEIPTYIFEPTDSNPIDCPGGGPAAANGICGFEAFPGDEKITVTDLDLGANYPNNDNIPITKMVVLLSDVSFAAINNDTYSNGIAAELDADSNGDISPDTVTGLTNDVPYFFKSAMLDAAQNLFYFTSNNEILDACGAVPLAATAATVTPQDDIDCKYIATPSKVYGLLTEDFNCFITTAAYGSSFAPKVIDFKAFRNKFLVPSELGRKIIFFYYDVGPKAARWLGENSWAKPFVRAALLPAWLFVETASFLGLVAATILFTSIFILLICGFYILRSNKRRIEI
jgi:hypothetical protein